MNKNDKSNGGLKLVEAVEALTKIAETPWEEEVYEEEIKEIDFKDPHWLQAQDKEKVVSTVKNIFRVILNHLKDCYQEQYRFMENTKTVEGIKTIMVLVGEAAKKIDRYTDLFHTRKVHSVTETTEYQQLKDFYDNEIAKTINEAMVSKWIFALSLRTFKAREKEPVEFDTRHVFVDLDSVKNDTEYELFFIKKGDGTRFFSPRLVRNIKLICDFGLKLGKQVEEDPLVDLPIWQDHFGQEVAGAILKHAKSIIKDYYPLIIHHKDIPFFASLHKALLALYLASRKEKLVDSGSSKGCLDYFADFQFYLREALESRKLHQVIAFPPQELNPEEEAAKKIIVSLVQELFEGKVPHEKLDAYLHAIFKGSHDSLSPEHKKVNVDNPLWSRLAGDYVALQKYVRPHANGPLNKLIFNLEEGDFSTFDPYLQMQLPLFAYRLHYDDIETSVHSLASPTRQEAINQAAVIPEWLAYLHTKAKNDAGVLMIDYQDNTSWREYARAHVLEDLQEGSDFNKILTVVSLPKDTEFYHQLAPYDEIHQLVAFKNQLCTQVLGNHTGFYIPDSLRQKITEEWIEGVFLAINRVFFSNKNVLSREARLDFIEIFYLFLELKILEITKAKHLFLTCKDGIDISPPALVSLSFLVSMLQGKVPSKEEIALLTTLLYKPALLGRERLVLQGRMGRMLSAIKVIENAVHDFGLEGFQRVSQQAFKSDYTFHLGT